MKNLPVPGPSVRGRNRSAERRGNALSRIFFGGNFLLVAVLLLGVGAVDAQIHVFVHTPRIAENAGVASVGIQNGSQPTDVNWATKDGTATQPADYASRSGTLRFNPFDGRQVDIPIANDSDAEGEEHFFLTVNGTDYRISIEASDTPDASDVQFAVSPATVMENAGTARFTITYTGPDNFLRVDYATKDGTAMQPGDYASSSVSRNIDIVETGTSWRFDVPIIDDGIWEAGEHFFITVSAEDSLGRINGFDHRITIADSSPDPMPRAVGRHAIARTEALVENQPRLIPMLRNPGAQAAEFSMRVTDDGVESAGGGFQGETVWGATTLSRATDGDGEHEHLLTSLGAHVRLTERMHLGGMLQFDRSDTKPGGEIVSGEISGGGWMIGPYFAMRDAAQPLYFEGRLLYGRASNDVDALLSRGADASRSASPDSRRWLAKARVEGTFRFGSDMTLVPLADFSHARDEIEPFADSGNQQAPGQTISLSKLQVGAELEIPIPTARGDLKFRPGLRFVASDAVGDAFAREEDRTAGPRSSSRIDFGIDYRLEDSVALGFESFYSGIGREDLESYGAGIDLRLEF